MAPKLDWNPILARFYPDMQLKTIRQDVTEEVAIKYCQHESPNNITHTDTISCFFNNLFEFFSLNDRKKVVQKKFW